MWSSSITLGITLLSAWNTAGQQPFVLDTNAIAAAKCVIGQGTLQFDKSSAGQVLEFYGIPQNARRSSTWYCDFEAPVVFDSVMASYTLVAKDPKTGGTQDPDDSDRMLFWGEDVPGNGGYFSFGTPQEILNHGGSLGSNVYAGREGPITFLRRSTKATTTVRFGFCQSANHEDFSIKNIKITVFAAPTTTSTTVTSATTMTTTTTTTTNTLVQLLHRNATASNEDIRNVELALAQANKNIEEHVKKLSDRIDGLTTENTDLKLALVTVTKRLAAVESKFSGGLVVPSMPSTCESSSTCNPFLEASDSAITVEACCNPFKIREARCEVEPCELHNRLDALQAKLGF
eukprot:m.204450 g.204450  ORF g.204450 m.204450 type:complete len:346 (+) comp32888_c4_seq1:247-1284(+)